MKYLMRNLLSWFLPMAMDPASPFSRYFQFYQDDNSDPDSCTAIGTENVKPTLDADTNYILRIKIENITSTPANQQWTLEYEVNNSGTWNTLNTTSSNVRTATGTPTDLAACDVELQTATAASSAFENGEYDDGDGATNVNLGGNADTEHAWCMTFRSVDLSDNDVVDIRLLHGGTIVGGTLDIGATINTDVIVTAAGTVAITSDTGQTAHGSILGKATIEDDGVLEILSELGAVGATGAFGVISFIGELGAGGGTQFAFGTVGITSDLTVSDVSLAFGTTAIAGDLAAIGTSLGGTVNAVGTIAISGDLAGVGTSLASGTIAITSDLAAVGTSLARGTISVLGDQVGYATHLAFGTINLIGDLAGIGTSLGGTVTAAGTIAISGDLAGVGTSLAFGTAAISGDLAALGTGFVYAVGTVAISGDLAGVGTSLAFGTSALTGTLSAGSGTQFAFGTIGLTSDLAAVGTDISAGDWTYVGGNDNQFDGATISLTHGLTINEGDLVVAYVHTNINESITPDEAGWTEADQRLPDAALSARHGLWWKVAGASEPASYGFSWSTSVNCAIVLKVFRPSAGAPVVDSAINHAYDAATSDDCVIEATNGQTVADNSVSIIAWGKDIRTGTTHTYGSADNSYVDVEGATGNDQTSGMAHRFFSSGETLNFDVTVLQDEPAGDNTYSYHISFILSSPVIYTRRHVGFVYG